MVRKKVTKNKITKKAAKTITKKPRVSRGTKKKTKKPLNTAQVAKMRVDYEANVLSEELIGKKYGVSKPAVQKHASKGNWKRQSVKKRLNADVLKKMAQKSLDEKNKVAKKVAKETDDYLDAYADVVADVAMMQKGRIQKSLDLTEELQEDLRNSIKLIKAQIEQDAEKQEQANKENPDKAKPVKKGAGLLGLVAAASKTLNNLSLSHDRMTKLQRTVHGLDNEDSEIQSYDDLVD